MGLGMIREMRQHIEMGSGLQSKFWRNELPLPTLMQKGYYQVKTQGISGLKEMLSWQKCKGSHRWPRNQIRDVKNGITPNLSVYPKRRNENDPEHHPQPAAASSNLIAKSRLVFDMQLSGNWYDSSTMQLCVLISSLLKERAITHTQAVKLEPIFIGSVVITLCTASTAKEKICYNSYYNT